MEFEEMKKIWDEQNKKTMYAIDEDALHRRIKSKGNRAERTSKMNEFGLMTIAVVTASILFFNKEYNFYNALSAVALLLMGVYVLIGRIRRLKTERQFDRSMLGELDRAISNTKNEALRARTFIWWMIVPVAIPTFAGMIAKGASLWQIAMIVGSFVLAFFVTRWDLKRVQIPRKRELEVLRENLVMD